MTHKITVTKLVEAEAHSLIDQVFDAGAPAHLDLRFEHELAREKNKLEHPDGGFHVGCSCGWVANNPLPDDDSAEAAKQQHLADAARDEEA